MNKYLAIPLMVLATSIVACGKKDGESTAPSTTTSSQASNSYNYSIGYTNWTGGSFQSFCSAIGGQFSNNICVQQSLNYQNQAWLSVQYGTISTNIPVYAGQRVTVNVSGNPKVLVGNYQYASGSATFTASNSGYLIFTKNSLSTYSVQQIQIVSCFSAPNQLTNCY